MFVLSVRWFELILAFLGVYTKYFTDSVYLTYHSGAGGLDRVDRPLSDIDIANYDRYYLIRFE
jgi:hypothetical protein